ncbi:UNVERIFIED_CONTAM: hypothetical protein Sradi_1294600, partial [Sesamum radiatum]
MAVERPLRHPIPNRGNAFGEDQGIPFSEEIMADELPINWKEPSLPEYYGTTDPQEHLSYFENVALLHCYTT